MIKKEKAISAVKPTSWSPTLGNYLGAITHLVKQQENYEMYVFIADLHALTLPISKKELKENTINLVATYLAAGLDPDKIVLFKQSDVPAHSMLEWVLTCNTNLGDLTKMPQYKNFLDKHQNEAVPCGILNYVSLMNADILLYDIDKVFVGYDQLSHIMLARDIAERFNKKYENSFVLPEALITRTGSKIMSLSDPTKKMSKSESDKGTIYLLDDLNVIRNKIKKAVTDNESRIYYDPIKKPGISNLLTIYAACNNISILEAEKIFEDEKDYGIFKSKVADVVCEEISKLQDKINTIKNSNIIESVLNNGAEKANLVANKKINKIYKKIGLR